MHSEILSKTFKMLLRKLLGITCFLIFGLFLVIIVIFLYIYRSLVYIVLRIQLRNKFAGMLESSDALWCIEDVTLSMVTIVIILKKPVGSTNTIFLKNIRKFFSHLSKTVPTELEKLFFYRYQKYGYFYWDKSHTFNPETAIRWLECENNNCDGSCENAYSTTFQENLGSICNRPLYDNHKPMWEMLIGRRCPKSSSYIEEDSSSFPEDRFNTDVDEIPVIFRFHHSLCDGVAIFNVVNKVLADEGMIEEQSSIINSKNDSSTAKENQFKEKQRTLPKRRIISNLKQVYNTIKEITIFIRSILFGLEIWISQLVCSKEKSVLRGQPLTGEKLIFSCMENNANKSQLFMKIKKLKQCTGARVNDIIITAFAAGLSRYYSRMKEVIPEAVSVFIPVRMSTSDENVVLTNDFSLLMVKSCFIDADKTNILTINKTCRFFERLQRIKSTNNKIRNSLEAPLNFFLIKRVFGLLPAEVLRSFSVRFCTMIFSNIKGIRRKIHIVKHPVSNMMFSIPNRGLTGIGLTALTYEDKLNLSLVVDTAIIKDRELIKEILEETIREINSAYDSLA